MNLALPIAHTQVVDVLLDKVESMPAELQSAKVSQKDFEAMVGLARRSHSLRVALNFYDQVSLQPPLFKKNGYVDC